MLNWQGQIFIARGANCESVVRCGTIQVTLGNCSYSLSLRIWLGL